MDEERDEIEQHIDKPDFVSYPGIKSESELQLNGIVGFIPDATFAIDKKGRVIAWNRAMESMTGVKADDILGIGDYEYSLPFYGFRQPILIDLVLQPDPNLEAEYEAMERDGMSLTGEVFISSFGTNGSYIWAKASPLYDSNGNITGAIESTRDITERKYTEDALKERESKFRLLFERSADAMFLLDGRKFIDCNNAAVEMMKCSSRTELLDIHPSEISPERQRDGRSSREKSEDMIKKAFEKGTHKFEWTRLRSNGEEFPVMITLTVIPWKGEQILHVTVKDITERKAAEKSLLQSRELYRNLVENLNDIILFLDPSGRITYISPVVEQVFGYSPRELIGRSFEEHIHKDDLAGVKERFEQAITGKLEAYEFRFLDKENRVRYVRASARLSGVPDSLKGLTVTLTDITDHKKAEMELKESEDRYRLLVESSPDGIMIHQDGIVIFANRASAVLLNADKPEELVGKPVMSFVHPDYIRTVQDRIHSTQYARDEAPLIEEKFLGIDGTQIDVEVAAIPFTNRGKPATQVVFREITRRKKAEEALQRYKLLSDHSRDIILFIQKEDGRILEANDAAMRTYGCSRKDLLNLTIHDLRAPASSALTQDQMDVAETQGILFETVHKRHDGSLFPVEVSSEGAIIGGTRTLISVVRDISERCRAIRTIERLANFPDENPNPVLRISSDSAIIYANQSSKELLGQWGCQVGQLLPNGYRNIIEKTLRSGKSSEIECVAGKIVYSLVFAPIAGMGYVNIYGEDITERKQAKNALMESEERYRTLSEAAPDLIFIVNRDDKVEYVNKFAAKYLGLQPEEVIGRARSELFPQHISDKLKLGLQKAFENGEAFRNSNDKTSLCGRDVWLDTQIVPLRKNSGIVTAVMEVSRDITDLKRSEEILRNAKEAAEAATRAKSEFLANMSHEIRTPMNAVIGMTDLLLDEDLTSNQKECLETIRRSGEALLSIINNILDLSKIEAGLTDLECQPFELHRCVETSLDLVSADANKKGLSIKCEFEDSAPAVILGDPTRLSQILVNLLSNSVKFTETGEISLAVSAQRLEGENYEIHFAVKDTGIGIPRDKMERLFKSFSQIDSSTTRKYGGTGLGLAISKKLVEMMNGTIWVESEAGSDTTFHFTIKVEKTLKEPIDLIKLDSKYDARLHGNLDPHLSILLAEDNLVNQMVTQRMLNKLGCRADIASNGIEVLRALERQSYDVIIMDVLMPEMDGLEATKEIRRRWPGNSPKIIAMTASVLKGDRETCLAAGMDGYISKPAKLVELRSALESKVITPR